MTGSIPATPASSPPPWNPSGRRALLGEHRGRPRRRSHQRAGRPDERPDVHLPVEHHRHGRQVAPMSPADRPDPSPEPLPDDPDGSAPGPPEPEDLDVLVDRLAAE